MASYFIKLFLQIPVRLIQQSSQHKSIIIFHNKHALFLPHSFFNNRVYASQNDAFPTQGAYCVVLELCATISGTHRFVQGIRAHWNQIHITLRWEHQLMIWARVFWRHKLLSCLTRAMVKFSRYISLNKNINPR